MKKEKCDMLTTPPRRPDFVENPVTLCHDISRLTRAKARETSINGVLSQPGARRVLSLLAVYDGVTQRTLVEATHLRAPTVSVILQKMEEEGMVERKRNPDDMREIKVCLTDYGREVDRDVVAKIKQTDALVLESLSPDEQKLLMALLGRMRDRLVDSIYEGRRDKQ